MNAFEKENILHSTGERIRKMRIVQYRTSTEIADYLDITTQAYGNLNRGKADISISRLVELAKFFEVPLVQLLTENHYTAIIQFENNELNNPNYFVSTKIEGNVGMLKC